LLQSLHRLWQTSGGAFGKLPLSERGRQRHYHYARISDDVVTPLCAPAVNFPLVEVTDENGPFEMARGMRVLPREQSLAKVESGEIPMGFSTFSHLDFYSLTRYSQSDYK